MFESEITSYSSDGSGIAKLGGYTVFVPHTVLGDVVKIRIEKDKKSYGYGKAVQIIKPSENRVAPPCDVYSKCGGCSLMHMSYSEQLRLKRRTVVDAIERIGGFRGASIAETEGMEDCFHYRNKAQLPVAEQGGEIAVGFFAPRSHRVVGLRECLISHLVNTKVTALIKDFMKEYNIPPYDEATHEGIVRHIYTRVGCFTGELMISLVINSNGLPHSEKLAEILKNTDYGELKLVGVVLNINRNKGNTILGKENAVLYGRDYIFDELDGIRFKISHNSFYQVNPRMTLRLYRKAYELCEFKGTENVFDLYCGAGTISLFLARGAKKVTGIEIVPEAVRDAEYNAKLNGIENCTFYAGKAEKMVPELYSSGERADIVVLDPPRKGCDASLLDTIGNMSPGRIVYISCNPATMARDLKRLAGFGYELTTVHPFDQFPMTPHVECVVLMSRVEK